MNTLITSPRDPRLLDSGNYGALAVSPTVLRGLMRTAGQYGGIVNASDFDADGDADVISYELMQETARDMLATGSGERFPMPDGDHELVVLRFVAESAPLSIVYVEDYDQSYPALVNGHLIDRADAIAAWLGDTDGSEHPDLFPSGSWQG